MFGVPEVSVEALNRWLQEGKELSLLDVREPQEYEICRIGGARLIPLGQLRTRLDELEGGKDMVVYCHTGSRSSAAVRFLNSTGFKNAVNLKGGIDEWARRVDPSMPRYR
ncbi:MAG: hypothetical protein JRN39_01610 [Nitrososphaerota archaeon]|nr:hypothetical protein [Nitrososphaerota archaeon]MDG6939082.1 hypothetical protein [Nitrososphaerota archaeon]